MAKILLVEDDDFFRLAIKSILELGLHQVTEAANGRVARDILVLDTFDIIITDIQMPYLDGLELLQWLKDQGRKQSIIVMTGFAHMVETQKAYDLGATHFLAKPFDKIELEKIINEIKEKKDAAKPLNQNNKNNTKKRIMDYCKVSIDEFVSKSHLEFELYILLGQETFVKIANEGSKVELEKILAFKEKGIRHLYVKKEDFGKLIGFNIQLSKILTEQNSVAPEKKVQFLRYTGEVILEKVFIDGIDKPLLIDTKEYLESCMGAISDVDGIFTLLTVLNSHTDYIYAHSLGTAIYSNMIAKKMKITSAPLLMKLTMGGLFHDIGKKEIDPEILKKPRSLLNHEERKTIESHASRGYEILDSIKEIPSDVAQIAYEHHEDMIGQGYPRMLEKDQVHPLAKIVGLANIFCNYVIQNPQHKLHKPGEAFMKIETDYKQKIDKKILTALSEIITDRIKNLDGP